MKPKIVACEKAKTIPKKSKPSPKELAKMNKKNKTR